MSLYFLFNIKYCITKLGCTGGCVNVYRRHFSNGRFSLWAWPNINPQKTTPRQQQQKKKQITKQMSPTCLSLRCSFFKNMVIIFLAGGGGGILFKDIRVIHSSSYQMTKFQCCSFYTVHRRTNRKQYAI